MWGSEKLQGFVAVAFPLLDPFEGNPVITAACWLAGWWY